MAPIEHILDDIGCQMYTQVPKPRTYQDLSQTQLLNAWENILQRRIAFVKLSMRLRCIVCIDANGSCALNVRKLYVILILFQNVYQYCVICCVLLIIDAKYQ